MKSTTKNNGFTLVELLITIAILGIILGVSVPVWSQAKKNTLSATRNGNLTLLNATADRASLDDIGNNIAVVNPTTGVSTSAWAPKWPQQFFYPIPANDAERKARAGEVLKFFVQNGYLPDSQLKTLSLNGIGYDVSGYFILQNLD